MVPKKDGSARVVINYVAVNRLIAPFQWSCPSTDYVARKLLEYEWFSFWDFFSGYHASPIKETSRYLTAILWPDHVLTQYRVAGQGFVDSGNWFTFHVHTILDDPLCKKHIAHCVDDGHMGSQDIPSHLMILEHFLE